MDAKITKKRLAHMLSYDWVKIIGAVAAAILVWTIIFTMTATRITNTQKFVVCNYAGLRFGKEKSAEHSYEIIEKEWMDNMRGGESMFSQLFQANLEVGEGDVMFVSDYHVSREAKKDEDGNELKDSEDKVIYEYSEETYLSQALTYYYGYFSRLDDGENEKGYFTQMKEYLDKFYDLTGEEQKTYGETVLTKATFDENTLNEDLAEAEFRARIQANKDKRFKTEAQIAAAVPQEIARIRSYLKAYDDFFAYADSGYISFTVKTVKLSEEFTLTGTYGINLCPDEQKMGGLKEHCYYVDFEGVVTAKNINATFLNLKELDKNFQYENLLFINALIESVCTDLR